MARTTKKVALALFVLCTAALAMLVHVVTVNNRSELVIRAQRVMPGQYVNGYGLALQPVEESAPQQETIAGDVTVESPTAEAPEAPEAPYVDPETAYASLHPVYTRCAAKVDMLAFSLSIQKTCGDIHELSDVAWPCRQAMSDYSKKFGCCWETVMDAYESLYPEAANSWRLWQGTLSGKAGVTFESQNCGDSMGEKGYTDLQKEVKSLKNIIETQSDEIMTLESYLGYGGNPYYYYYYKGGDKSSLKQGSKLHMTTPVYAPSKAYHPKFGGNKHAVRRSLGARRVAGRSRFNFLDNAKGSGALRRAGVKI